MRNASIIRPEHWLLAAVVFVFSAGCADDAARIERAREHQQEGDYRTAIIELKNVLQSDPKNIQARAMLGQVALQNGDSATAIKELQRARELGATPEQYSTNLARAFLREGRYQEVVKLSPDSVTDPTNRAELLALIGTAEFQRGDQLAAERRFLAALELVPDQSDALIGKAKLARERGDMSAAETGLAQALQSRPDDPESLAALAGLQQANGKYAQAEDNYKKALMAVEGTGQAQERLLYMSGLMDALISQGKTSQAQALGSTMIESTSEHPLALYKAARADFATGNYNGAIEKAERVITTMPSAEPPRMLLAGAAMAKGDSALAATHLQAIVDINPNNEKARRLLARVRMDMGNPEEALELLEPLIAAGTQDAQLLAMAGTANLRSGNTQAGIALMEQGMAGDISDPAFALQAAANFLATGEINRAIEVLEALPEAERVGQRELLLVLALLRKGDQAAARSKAESIVSARPESAEAHRLLGGFHLAISEFDQARSEFEKALELNPGDVAAVINLTRIDIAQQKPEQAEARFRAVLDSNPGNLLALTALAELAEARGDREAAIELLEQARTTNPKTAGPALQLGSYYLAAGNRELAAERANEAVRIAPANGRTHQLLGLVLMQDERPAEAIVHFERAIAATPDLLTAHYHLGRALAMIGKAEGSYESFQRAVEIDKTFFPARAALASAAIKRGDFKAAMSIAAALISDYPDRSEPLVLQARAQTERNDLSGALETYAKAAAILPSREIAASIYDVQKRMGAAEPWDKLQQWVDNHPDDTPARSMLGAAYMTAGMTELGVENLKQVMAEAPDAWAAMTLADAEHSAGDIDAAAEWLRKAVALQPTALAARAALAGLELQRGNTDSARKMLRDLRADYPDSAELDVLEGDTLMATGDFKGSIEAYDKALGTQPSELIAVKRYYAGKNAGDEDAWRVLENWLSDHPGHTSAGLTLAQDFGAREWNDEAVDVYRQVLRADPNNVVALNNIALVYLKRGRDSDLKNGLAAASKVYEQAPQNAAIADTYGWILYKDGQHEQAEKILSAASSADSEPEISYHHAVVLDALGKDAEAIIILDRLLADDASFASREEAEVLRRRLSP